MRPISLITAAIVLCTLTVYVHGQAGVRDAGSKIRGDAYRPYSARSYSRAARDHSRVLNYYAGSYRSIPRETAQEHAAEVRRNLDLARQETAKLKPQAEQDPVVAKHLTALDKHYAEADKQCTMLVEECAKQEGDTGSISRCCAQIETALKAAEAEHEKLMQHLKVPAPPKDE